MRRAAPLLLVVSLLALSCRTTAPAGAEFLPLTNTSGGDAALAELQQRREEFRGARGLARIRATTAQGTQSFRAQIHLAGDTRVELTAYSPLGTVAASLSADGDRVMYRESGKQPWSGSARDLAGTFGIFGAALTPAELAMLIIGLPPRSDLTYEAAPTGLARANAGDLSVVFDPAVYPPQKVVVTRGGDRVEIEFLELGAP